MRVLEEVQDAFSSRRPVKALESTILSHGLPYPDNIQLAKRLSTIFRSKNVIPATIAIRNGQCCIGLTWDELHDLVSSDPKTVAKCSTRDIPFLLASHHQQLQLFQQQQQSQQPKTLWGDTYILHFNIFYISFEPMTICVCVCVFFKVCLIKKFVDCFVHENHLFVYLFISYSVSIHFQ